MANPVKLPVSRLKYGNKFTTVDGIKFRSKRESVYYADYRDQQKRGEIHDLELQPRYKIVINGAKICTVVLDFQYRDARGELHVIDVKGWDDKFSKLKRKLVEALFPHVNIEVVK